MRTPAKFMACILGLTLLVALGMTATRAAEDLDPLLRLLVVKGIITQEEAAALQAESEALENTGREAVAPLPGKAPEGMPKKESWTDRIKPAGDMRLRYEGFDQKGAFDNDRRDRFRFRLRAGAAFTITDWMKFGLQLRSGDPADPVSNNTTFEGGFDFKDISIAEAYLDVQPTQRFGFRAGKFDPSKRWTVTDLQWDDDVTVEGLLTNVELASGDGVFKNLDLVTYIYLLEESGSGPDAVTYGGQLRSNLRLGDRNALRLGLGFDQWNHEQMVVDLTLGEDLAGNKVTNLLDGNQQLISEFEIFTAFAEYKNTTSARWPVSVKLFYYKNEGAKGIGADNDTGYFARVQVGDYAKKGQVACRYAYYYSEPDAMFYLPTQSDTSRGSNVKAHRLDLRIGFLARSFFNITWYNTRLAFGDDETLNRWQFDYIVKF